MAHRPQGDSGSWYADPTVLVAELRQGTFAPRRAPALEGFSELREIGRGGQAVVYAGIQRSTKRRVAVKVLLDGTFASQVNRRRFEREIELVASLRHPHIVGIHDSGSSPDGHPYCIMEFIEGAPLDEYVAGLKDGTGAETGLRKTVELIAAICDAVNYAHQRGVIHRDLKPGNIRIDPDGKPHILDFGLAKLRLHPTNVESIGGVSLAGQFVGSPAWASPEQARGEPDQIDIRSDVYSLGMILFFALTERFPYEVSGSMTVVLDRILTASPVLPSEVNPRVNADLETIVLRSLAKEPDRRYQTAGELAADLRRYLAGEPVQARSDSTWYVIRKGLRRYRTAVMIGGGVFVAAIALSVAMTIMYERTARAEESGREEVARASAINAFLSDMLASVNPEVKGRDVTVRTILDEASRELDGGLAGEPVVRASLHNIIATTFRGLGDYEKARVHWNAAIDMFRRQNGENDRHTIEAERELGELLIEESKFDEAEKIVLSSGARAHAQFPPDDIAAMHSDGSLARLRTHQNKWQEAEALYRPLVERMGRVLGPDHKETLANTNNLAAVYYAEGKYADAETTYRQVLRAQSARFGKESTAALSTMLNIAAVLNAVGRLTEAEALLQDLTVSAMKVWGPEHRLTMACRMNLSFNLGQQGRHEEALQIALEILPVQKRVLGPEHENTILTMGAIAASYVSLKQYDKAVPIAEEAYETSRRLYGETNEGTLTAMHNYASALSNAGRLVDAERIFSKNLELCRDLYAPDHPDLAWPMNELAGIWVRQGKTGEAADLYADAIRIVRKGLPPDHYFLPWLIFNRGSCLRDAKRFEEAEKDLLECYELYRKKGGDVDSDTQSAIRAILRLYQLWNKPEETARFSSLLARPATTPAKPPSA